MRTLLTRPPVGSTNLGTTPFSDITTTLLPLTTHGGQANEAVQDLGKIPGQIAGFEAKVEAMETREDSLKYRQQSLREVKQRYTPKQYKLMTTLVAVVCYFRH
jgi:hypothetical protein